MKLEFFIPMKKIPKVTHQDKIILDEPRVGFFFSSGNCLDSYLMPVSSGVPTKRA